jgi:hypothetical protein
MRSCRSATTARAERNQQSPTPPCTVPCSRESVTSFRRHDSFAPRAGSPCVTPAASLAPKSRSQRRSQTTGSASRCTPSSCAHTQSPTCPPVAALWLQCLRWRRRRWHLPALPSAHAKKPHRRASQWKYARPLLPLLSLFTTARCAALPHRHEGVGACPRCCSGLAVLAGVFPSMLLIVGPNSASVLRTTKTKRVLGRAAAPRRAAECSVPHGCQ